MFIDRCTACEDGDYDLCKKCSAKGHHIKHKANFDRLRFGDLTEQKEQEQQEQEQEPIFHQAEPLKPGLRSVNAPLRKPEPLDVHVKELQELQVPNPPIHWKQPRAIIVRQAKDGRRNKGFIKVVQNRRSQEYVVSSGGNWRSFHYRLLGAL